MTYFNNSSYLIDKNFNDLGPHSSIIAPVGKTEVTILDNIYNITKLIHGRILSSTNISGGYRVYVPRNQLKELIFAYQSISNYKLAQDLDPLIQSLRSLITPNGTETEIGMDSRIVLQMIAVNNNISTNLSKIWEGVVALRFISCSGFNKDMTIRPPLVEMLKFYESAKITTKVTLLLRFIPMFQICLIGSYLTFNSRTNTSPNLDIRLTPRYETSKPPVPEPESIPESNVPSDVPVQSISHAPEESSEIRDSNLASTSSSQISDEPTLTRDIIPFRGPIVQMPDPQFYGIKATDILTIEELDDDFEIKDLARARYMIKPIPRLPYLLANVIGDVFRTGADCNDIIRQMITGDFNDGMARGAADLCFRILRGYAHVPDDSLVIIPYPRTTDRYEWNGRTTALFYLSALFVVVFQLRQRNMLTPQMINYAYEQIMKEIGTPVQGQRVFITCSHTYGDVQFNYSPNDVTNQIKMVDWLAVWWNHHERQEVSGIKHHLSMWIKMILLRSGDARKVVQTDQIIVPKPIVRESFSSFKPGALVSHRDFASEIDKITNRPASLKQNEITEVTYSYPPVGEWMTDRGDRYGVPEFGKNIIVYTALLVNRTYNVQDLIHFRCTLLREVFLNNQDTVVTLDQRALQTSVFKTVNMIQAFINDDVNSQIEINYSHLISGVLASEVPYCKSQSYHAGARVSTQTLNLRGEFVD
ncbi:hypothetical protein TUBRATIS_31610 [Tubulinosema ratisbonensis]|uniref:Uncharacterized protein n=1 Tax=Tubulinosema ratisbonensis TaxID=291195 RepID=A0A437AH93_9MICR|nr:hypothetical protein TUBRATIS_31610 [Tubulinosema ratisbonensis]